MKSKAIRYFCRPGDRPSQHRLDASVTIKSGQAAKLAYIDTVLASIEMPAGHRRASWSEIAGECWTNSWPKYVVHLAKFCGVDAIQGNGGAWLISERVKVCYSDELRRGLEEGWSCIRLPSIDDRAREKDLRAPSVLISPDADCFLWMPHGPRSDSLAFGVVCALLVARWSL